MRNKQGYFALAPGALMLTMGSAFAQKAEKKVTIQNEFLRVDMNDANGEFSIAALPSGKNVVASGKLGEGGAAKKIAVNDANFGNGQAISLLDVDGAGGKIMLFPKLPFALLRLNLKNNSAALQTLNRVPVASFSADWQSAALLKTLGTGGLADADKNPGSYAWLAVAEPQSRNGLIAGWLTHDRASGVLFTKIDGDKVRVEARSDYGKLHLAPGQSAESETLAIGYFDDARLGLESWADTVAKIYAIKLLPSPSGYCTWYSDKHGGASDEMALAELSDYAAKNLKPFGFDFVQIDDGWQMGDPKGNGPKKNFTQFNPTGAYKSGMKETADKIKALGLTPGIWFMPFAATHNDPWFADKQNFFIKHEDGTPFDTSWGGTSLDMTNPQARDYLRGIVNRIAHEWGYTYFKMDGLYTGIGAKQVYVNSGYKEDNFGDSVLSDPAKTNIEAFRDGLKLVRETAGKNVFFLGCTMTQNMRSFGGSIGLVDAMRIGPDNNGSWKGWVGASPVFGSRYYFLNGRVWYNDPDPFYLRGSIPLEEARTIASWPAIAGQLNSSSDWLPDFTPERLDILRRTMPSHGATARPVDFFENDPPRLWAVTSEANGGRRDVLGIFNWSNEEATFDVPLSRFGLPNAEYAAFDYWANTFLPTLQGNLKTTLPAHGCRILAVRPLLNRPFLLGTSRHITQGIIDVSDEKWSAKSKTLSGQSEIVGGDAYELRVVSPNLKAIRAEADGGEIKLAQEGTFVRATIYSATNRVVKWKIVFAAQS